MPVPSSWHSGEIAAQQARGYEDAVWGMWMNYEEGAPSFMVAFLTSLPFLSVTTLDEHGRPWASLICNDGQSGFIQEEQGGNASIFKCTIQAPKGVPIRECLLRLKDSLSLGIEPYHANGDTRQEFIIAAVGVMLHNRRRNKMEGVILSVDQTPTTDADSQFIFRMQVSNTFGNCPKYINMRQLIPSNASVLSSTVKIGESGNLPSEVLSILTSTDTLFLATKHSGSCDAYPVDPFRAGNNIRGGPSGFLRIFWDTERDGYCIVLPDWSGNRLMQSFGNMTQDPVAGITIPVWKSSKSNESSDVLHLTCDALVLANEEASRLIRGVQGAVKLWPREWTLIREGLPLVLASNTLDEAHPFGSTVIWSPYNPPVRLLTSEKPSLVEGEGAVQPIASLVDTHFYSPVIATFVFQIDRPLAYLPGQHIVLDCYHLLDTRVQIYTHMAHIRGKEKDLNDDGTRSWTISYASSLPDPNITQFEVTLRRKNGGGVTPGLFRLGKILCDERESNDQSSQDRLQLGILGLDGSCLLPSMDSTREGPLQLAYLVSGIGLTPLLPHLNQLCQSDGHAKILIIAAVKWNEIIITKKLIRRALTRNLSKSNVNIRVFLLAGSIPDGETESEKETEEEQFMPSEVTLDYTVIHGRRLLPLSLISRQKSDNGFFLPIDALMELQQAKQVVICAGDAFTKTAREAVKRAGISDDKVKVESFLF